MATITAAKKLRFGLGKTQEQCAGEFAALTGTEPNQGRWGRLERGEVDMMGCDYSTIFWMARILRCETWEIVPAARRRVQRDWRNARRRVERFAKRAKR